ncbi:MAG TPA: LbtU family siderophore porin [Guyparkeria sp.]|nr:LbtU family siderophore porin [Guyparkeria sp.]
MHYITRPGRLAGLLSFAIALASAAVVASADGGSEFPTIDFPSIDFQGLLEIEADYSSPYTGADESDIVLDRAELGLEVLLNEWLSAEVSTLYKEDDTPFELDTAAVSVIHPDQIWSVRAGQLYLPFGLYESAMISEPLTYELGETRKTAISAQAGIGGFRAGLYAFNGDLGGKNRIDNWGGILAYEAQIGEADLLLSGGYINHLGESREMERYLTEEVSAGQVNGDKVAAWTTAVVLDIHDVITLVGEYLAAIDDFTVDEMTFREAGARPAAWNVEAAHEFGLHGRQAEVAIGYQGSEEAIALGLPKSRALAVFAVDVWRNTTLSFEYAHDRDYGVAVGGTGKTAGTFITQLAVVF